MEVKDFNVGFILWTCVSLAVTVIVSFLVIRFLIRAGRKPVGDKTKMQ
jgi:hypothetical protein